MIGVVIPTIAGREALLERTVSAYRKTSDCTIVVVRDRPTIGQAWNDGVAALIDNPEVAYLHLSADDVEPHEGWDEAAMEAVWHNAYPSPRLLNEDGTLHSCGTMGAGMLLPETADWTACAASPFPFLRAQDWERIGPSLPIHYYADDYLGWRARCCGLDVVVSRGYCFTHMEGVTGRARVAARAFSDRDTYLAAVGALSLQEASCGS